MPWCGVSFSAVNVALGDGSLFHVCVVVWFRWLNFSVMLCWRSFSLSPLSLPFLPSAFPPPLSPSLSVRIDDGATLGVAFPVSGVFGAMSKREAPWVI